MARKLSLKWTPERIVALVGSLLALAGMSGWGLQHQQAARVEPMTAVLEALSAGYGEALAQCRDQVEHHAAEAHCPAPPAPE